MRRAWYLAGAGLMGVWLAVIAMMGRPEPVTAGGFPCFQCHGVNFEGSDLAPRVNGTKLTDAEIIKQVRNPRGVMPAYGAGEHPDDQSIISYIRSLPPAGPTYALSKADRIAALSTIAAVAGARAKSLAAASAATPAPVALASSPTPVVAAPVAAVVQPSISAVAAQVVVPVAVSSPAPAVQAAPVAEGTSPLGVFVVLGLLLGGAAGAVWVINRR